MPEEIPSPSEIYGRTEGLPTYKMARSLDGQSRRPDTPIDELARDTVRTALRQDRDAGDMDIVSRIDVDVAANALIEALEVETLGHTTAL